jgi:hypothetical protein
LCIKQATANSPNRPVFRRQSFWGGMAVRGEGSIL